MLNVVAIMGFSPPYGDCTEWHCLWAVPLLLSPPYGDDTMDFYYWGIVNLLSPPYGDGTAPRGKDTGKAQFSPPLRGLHHPVDVVLRWYCCFRPLTGIVLSGTPPSLASRGFRPLTGIVLI